MKTRIQLPRNSRNYITDNGMRKNSSARMALTGDAGPVARGTFCVGRWVYSPYEGGKPRYRIVKGEQNARADEIQLRTHIDDFRPAMSGKSR